MKGVKISHQSEFPRVGRVLFIGAETGKTAIVRVTNANTGQIVRSKHFENYNEALNYYSVQFGNLKSAEEFEVMRSMIETLGCKSEGE